MTKDSQQLQDDMPYSPTYHPWSDPLNPWSGSLPKKADVTATIYFHGLLGLCFDQTNKCIVGVNNKAAGHVLQVQVKEIGNCDHALPKLPSNFEEVTITVTDPLYPGVWVYAPVVKVGTPPVAVPDPGATEGRYSFVYYGLDLEGPDFHNKPLRKIPDALSPRFHIDNGLFYTRQISKSDFAVQRSAEKPINKKVGLVLAADIYLKNTGKITFNCKDPLSTCKDASSPCLTLPEAAGKKYEIVITNSCRSRMPDPGTIAIGTSVTDFQMNYDVINDSSISKSDLLLITPSSAPDPIKLGTCPLASLPFSDPAPCLPVTFGRSTNLD